MSVVAIYDWDYFHYSHVIPSLECAKMIAYQRQKLNNIAVFKIDLNPDPYTTFYIQKDYDDGVYIPELLKSNVVYGGRAFSEKYQPKDMYYENIVPDFSIYNNYQNLYCTRKTDEILIKKILYATHFRISLDEKNIEPFPFDRLQKSHTGVVLHDYNLNKIPQCIDLLKEICNMRSPRPYGIGNKFPINTYSIEELIPWLQITPIKDLFYIQYNGVFKDEELIEILNSHQLEGRQLVYNFTYGCSDENDFLINVLPIIYKQLLFLRRYHIKVLLNIDEDFIKTKELKNLIILLSSFYQKYNEDKIIPVKRTLYHYCSNKRMAEIQIKPWKSKVCLTLEEMREVFQYVRIHNYRVFDMFYTLYNVKAEGGKLVYDYSGNQN